MKAWISAFRLRTLPLALSGAGFGVLLSFSFNPNADGLVAGLIILTTIFLQVLSNLANDYGDSEHGADSDDREGPSRAVQTGAISKGAMLRAIVICATLALGSGVTMLLLTFPNTGIHLWLFLILGIGAIAAAMKYTMGKNPYGYAGLGDLFVLLFFGYASVLGTVYILTGWFHLGLLLPATSIGLLAVGVLNINNIRDIESDKKAGKRSIPVRIGRKAAVNYHWVLIVVSIFCSSLFVYVLYQHPTQLLYLIVVPLFIRNGYKVSAGKTAQQIDPLLKQLAISTFLFSMIYGAGFLIASTRI